MFLVRRQRQWENSESRASAQRGELSAVKETHQQGEVERQLLEREKTHLSKALAQVKNRHFSFTYSYVFPRLFVVLRLFFFFQAESHNAELLLLLNKLQSEDAALRDSLIKMGNLNEGLAQDKVDLNTYILQAINSCTFPSLKTQSVQPDRID